MKELSLYAQIALYVLIIGGINWGLVGLTGHDLIAAILGGLLSRLIYLVVGAAAGYFCYLIYLEKFKKS